jgi:restriction endonuclease S subunit
MTRLEAKRLGDIIQLEYGKPLPPVDRNPDGLYPVYGANGEKDRSNRFYRDSQSIIVGRKGSAGEITLTEEKYWPLDVTYYVDFDRERYDLRFLYYLLKALNLPSLAKGVKPGINRNEVYDLPVMVPLLPEQRRIVAILDKAFDGIAIAKTSTEKSLQDVREIIESYIRSVLHKNQNGWERKNFEDCIIDVKYTAKIQKKYFLDTGSYPIVSQENGLKNGYWNKADDVYRVENPIVIFGDHTKILKYVDFDFVLGADGVKILATKTFLIPKFFIIICEGFGSSRLDMRVITGF